MKTIDGRIRIGSDVEGPFAVESVESFLGTLDAVRSTTGSTIQAFDARYVAGEEHLRTAVEHARRSRKRGENVADDPAVEILLYAAGRRQIDEAMEMGVGTGDRPVVIVVDGGDEAAAEAILGTLLEDAVVSPDRTRITSFFEITEKERRATDAPLEALVVERVALLDVEK
ncbi:MAG: KEOPS complex subunit Cgi121 [Halodesulfurarchaeum sp.]